MRANHIQLTVFSILFSVTSATYADAQYKYLDQESVSTVAVVGNTEQYTETYSNIIDADLYGLARISIDGLTVNTRTVNGYVQAEFGDVVTFTDPLNTGATEIQIGILSKVNGSVASFFRGSTQEGDIMYITPEFGHLNRDPMVWGLTSPVVDETVPANDVPPSRNDLTFDLSRYDYFNVVLGEPYKLYVHAGAHYNTSGYASLTFLLPETLEIHSSTGQQYARMAMAVPEPESYAMLMLGLALIGGIQRRRANRC